MSTILKSLKKLELEKEANRSEVSIGGYRGSAALNAQDGKYGWIKSAWFRRGIVVVIILCLGASSLYFYSQSRRATTEVQVAVNDVERDQPESSPKRAVPIQRKPPIADPPRSPGRAKTPETIPSYSSGKQAKDTPAQIKPRAARPGPEPTSSSKAGSLRRLEPGNGRTAQESNLSTGEDAISREPVQPPRPEPARPSPDVQAPDISTPSETDPAPEETEEPPQEDRQSEYDDVPILTGSSFKVEAIVWSSVKDDRMAVINSRILHEGDELDGYILVTIRPDDVVVRKEGGGKWRVKFGRP